jgi:hypothetical protein
MLVDAGFVEQFADHRQSHACALGVVAEFDKEIEQIEKLVPDGIFRGILYSTSGAGEICFSLDVENIGV